MRFIGRDESESSPINVALIPCPAIRPNNNLVVVPELPQSNGLVGSENFPPFTITSFPSSHIWMPQASKHFRVDCTSAPVDRLEIRDSPLANAANMSDRWEIDLSPGNVMLPSMAILF